MTAAIRLTQPCDDCGGTGVVDDPVAVVEGPRYILEPIKHPCPSCVSGWLPDDETVVALRKVIPCVKDDAIRALVAAARYQTEGKPNA